MLRKCRIASDMIRNGTNVEMIHVLVFEFQFFSFKNALNFYAFPRKTKSRKEMFAIEVCCVLTFCHAFELAFLKAASKATKKNQKQA